MATSPLIEFFMLNGNVFNLKLAVLLLPTEYRFGTSRQRFLVYISRAQRFRPCIWLDKAFNVL